MVGDISVELLKLKQEVIPERERDDRERKKKEKKKKRRERLGKVKGQQVSITAKLLYSRFTFFRSYLSRNCVGLLCKNHNRYERARVR